MVIKLLDGLAYLFIENFREASIRLSNISLIDDPVLTKFATPTDIAFYITIASLVSLNRKELRDQILQSSQFKNLMEVVPETSDIIENYLNGKYLDF